MIFMEFRYYDRPLETVSSFKHLLCLLAATNDYWLAVITNLWKARNIWYCMDQTYFGEFYFTAVQAILLFKSEIPYINQIFSFHHRVARRILGKIIWLTEGK